MNHIGTVLATVLGTVLSTVALRYISIPIENVFPLLSGLSPQILEILEILGVLCLFCWLISCLSINLAGVLGGAYLSDIMLETFVIERTSLHPNIDIGSLLKLDIISNHNEPPKILEDFVRLAFWLKFKGQVARSILFALLFVVCGIAFLDFGGGLKPEIVDEIDTGFINKYFLWLFVIATVINIIQACIVKNKIRRILPFIRDNSKDNKSKFLDRPDWLLILSAW